MAEEAEAVPLPGPRKTLGRLSGRHWNTPGEGDLDWISIANQIGQFQKGPRVSGCLLRVKTFKQKVSSLSDNISSQIPVFILEFGGNRIPDHIPADGSNCGSEPPAPVQTISYIVCLG